MKIWLPGDSCPPRLPPRLANLPTIDSGQPMEKVVRKVVGTYIAGAAAGTTGLQVFFFAQNPSPRLRWSITCGWELNGAFVRGTTTPTWQMTSIRLPAVTGGSTADLDTVFVDSNGNAATRNLPDGYEIDSAVKAVRGILTLNTSPGQDLAHGLFGSLVLEARWEPHDGFIDKEAVAQLLARADLSFTGTPFVAQNT